MLVALLEVMEKSRQQPSSNSIGDTSRNFVLLHGLLHQCLVYFFRLRIYNCFVHLEMEIVEDGYDGTNVCTLRVILLLRLPEVLLYQAIISTPSQASGHAPGGGYRLVDKVMVDAVRRSNEVANQWDEKFRQRATANEIVVAVLRQTS